MDLCQYPGCQKRALHKWCSREHAPFGRVIDDSAVFGYAVKVCAECRHEDSTACLSLKLSKNVSEEMACSCLCHIPKTI